MAKKTTVTRQRKTPKRLKSKKQIIGGPFIVGALICENILKEEAVSSIIRIVDKFTVEPPGELAAGVQAAFTTRLYVSFKSGDFEGTKNVKIKLVTPAGSAMPEVTMPLVFKGAGHGPSLHSEMAVPIREEGLHWVEVWLDDQLMTKTPIHVVFRKREASSETSSAASRKKR